MMTQSKVYTVKTLHEALSWLEEYSGQGGTVLAGGTDLFVGWQSDIPKPEHILYVGEIQELKGIDIRQDHLWIGPLTSMAEIAKSSKVVEIAPSLALAAGSLGSPPIRERATIGGNLCHASPAADTAAPLLALNAQVEIRNSKAARNLALEEFFTGPGETTLHKNELLTGINVPIIIECREFYLRLAQRRALACVKISVAGAATKNNGALNNIRLALGAVAPIPLLARGTMAILEGKKPTTALIEQAANKAMQECNPIEDIRSTMEYRRLMVGELVRDGINKLYSNGKVE